MLHKIHMGALNLGTLFNFIGDGILKKIINLYLYDLLGSEAA